MQQPVSTHVQEETELVGLPSPTGGLVGSRNQDCNFFHRILEAGYGDGCKRCCWVRTDAQAGDGVTGGAGDKHHVAAAQALRAALLTRARSVVAVLAGKLGATGTGRSTKPRPLRTYLALFAAALALPLLALAAFSLNRMASLEQAQLERRIHQVSEDLARTIDRELDRSVTSLETLATSRSLLRGDFAGFHAQATQALRRTKSAIILLEPDLWPLLNTRVPYGQQLPAIADRETAQRVVATKKAQISGLVIGSVSKLPIFNVLVPILAKGELRYVLLMALEASNLADMLKAQSLDRQWTTGITDLKGTIIARSERHDDFVGKALPAELFQQSLHETGAFRTVSIAGQPVVRVTSRSELAGWLVSATVPQAYLDEAHTRSQNWIMLLTVLALVAGGSLAYLFAGIISRPLAHSTAAAAALGKGQIVEPVTSPLVEANTLTNALSMASKELAQRSEHMGVLVGELAHRSKNLLAVVAAMASQTARQSGNVAEFQSRFGERLQGLASAQNLLVGQEWRGADLRELIVAQLKPFVDAENSRLTIEGASLFLKPEAVQHLGMAFHELATNASKHGALSTPEGRIAVAWRVARDDKREVFTLGWRESGGPQVRHSEHKGFGHVVLDQVVPQALGGTVAENFAEQGYRWELSAPAENIGGSH
jgi:two-component sensor histidine kinase